MYYRGHFFTGRRHLPVEHKLATLASWHSSIICFNLADSGVLWITPLCRTGFIGLPILHISQSAVGFIRTASANAFLDAPHSPKPNKTRSSSFSHRSWLRGRCRLPFTESRVDEGRRLYRFHGGNSPRHHGRSLLALSIHARDSGNTDGFQHTCDISHRIGGSSSCLEKPEASRTSFFDISS